jgi:hypothetical protein
VPRSSLEELIDAIGPARSELVLIGAVTAAARQDWRAAAWALQARWPSRWSPAGSRPPADEDDDWLDL